ncbi:RNA polymerase sigma factor [Nocardia harenae]|uniref:RNA polymerase sigma factor n=1 Tax=Nocardia harenae TaxID=358707 RepID=UPI00082A72A0|nr:sigma-70 family RNA polymerase sigma factor [Nocardia harenae]
MTTEPVGRSAYGPGPPGDGALFAALRADGFAGPSWDRFATEVCRYGIGVLGAWLATGEIARRAAAAGVPLTLGAEESARFLRDREFRAEFVDLAVAEALFAFRAESRAGTGWRPDRGASLKTWFAAKCAIAFVNELKKYRRAEARHQLTLAALRPEPEQAADPARLVADRAVLREYLLRLPQADRNIVWGKVCGYSHAEIAELFGAASARAVERRWATLRTREPWIGRLQGRSDHAEEDEERPHPCRGAGQHGDAARGVVVRDRAGQGGDRAGPAGAGGGRAGPRAPDGG